MPGITHRQILEAAEKVVSRRGIEKARLSEVAHELGITHAALYKHFKNKEDLFETLVTDWLERTEAKVLHYHVADGENRVQATHDWLSLLAATKRKSFESDSKMFKLCTVYIARSERVLTRHLTKLRNKAEEVLGVSSPNSIRGMALILSFEYFHNPMYSDYWNDPHLGDYFEEVWQLIEPKLQLLVAQQ
jgi:AcrR family transcriptional regulator